MIEIYVVDNDPPPSLCVPQSLGLHVLDPVVDQLV